MHPVAGLGRNGEQIPWEQCGAAGVPSRGVNSASNKAVVSEPAMWVRNEEKTL